MKVAFITTLNHNVGDDFVREGLMYLFKERFGDVEFDFIHKHSPISAFTEFEKIRNFKVSKLLNLLRLGKQANNRLCLSDIVVQSGAPVYWCHDKISHCADNEWYESKAFRQYKEREGNIFLNLAAGSCQTYSSKGNEFCELCNNYIQELEKLSLVTTLRDSLSEKIFENASLPERATVIPCSSIFAMDQHKLENTGEEYVVLNYMEGGAHYTFNQNIDFAKWEKTFARFYFELKEKENVVVCCHDEKELKSILSIDKTANVFYEKDDFLKYMKFYSKAKFGILNRVHGAFMLASFGKPAAVIGNDSRARMVEEIGLRHYFVNDVGENDLMSIYNDLVSSKDEYRIEFLKIKQKAYSDYMSELLKIAI